MSASSTACGVHVHAAVAHGAPAIVVVNVRAAVAHRQQRAPLLRFYVAAGLARMKTTVWRGPSHRPGEQWSTSTVLSYCTVVVQVEALRESSK